MRQHERLLAIVVVCIDNKEGLLYDITAGKHRLARAPGLFAVCRAGKALGKVVLFLKSVGHGADLFNSLANHLAEILFQIVTNDKDHAVKAGFQCVVNGIIHNNLAVGAYGRQLLDAAAKARADARRHNYKTGFHNSILSFGNACRNELYP